MFENEDHLAPLTNELLRLAFRGLDLPASPRVADLCCGTGSASRYFAEEFGATCTGVDRSEPLLRIARERALAAGFQEQLEFIQDDARHVRLQSHGFDLVLAMGGALTYMGRSEGLERIRFLLKPGGSLLLSDLIYLDSPVPESVAKVIEDEAPGNDIRSLPLAPAVRAVFEEGVFRFENEAGYRALLENQGYDVNFAFPVPESAWSSYYSRAVASREPSAGPRIPVEADELAAIYCWGGRWGLGYLVCGATAR